MAVPVTPEGARDQARRAAVRLLESVHELTGGSMSPTLERGWKVLVEPLDRPLEVGDVILLDCPGGRVIHRYLGSVTWGSPPQEHVIHAGDASALPGIAPASRVSGRVCVVVFPSGQRVRSLSELPSADRLRLSRFVARWELYARLRKLADAVPGLRRLLASGPGRSIRRSLRMS